MLVVCAQSAGVSSRAPRPPADDALAGFVAQFFGEEPNGSDGDHWRRWSAVVPCADWDPLRRQDEDRVVRRTLSDRDDAIFALMADEERVFRVSVAPTESVLSGIAGGLGAE